ncbi:MAG: hypothetical protein U9O96_05265 [Candidatus Thermoplasmatota archaeon]|nr:hypothetical protein [Candidatus Thermoplasmatota archaeon]
MGKTLWKKGLVVGVIAVFLGITLTPAIGTLNSPVLYEKDGKIYAMSDTGNCEGKKINLIKIEVNEYMPDGSIETRVVPLTEKEVNELKSRLYNAKTIEERFSMLKEYGLIPEETLLEGLEKGMYAKAERMGLVREKTQKFTHQYEEITDLRLPLMLTFFSHINAVYFLGNSIRMGLTPTTMLLNRLFGFNIPGIDLVDVCWATLGIINTQGLLGVHNLLCIPSFMILAGFVGYSVKLPIAYHIFSGYSVMTFAAGIGFHDFSPISPQ